MRQNKLTDKQISIINVIKKGNTDGTWADIDQILDRIEYTTTKESLQFSLRFLVNRGLIKKSHKEIRRGRLRIIYQPLMAAFNI